MKKINLVIVFCLLFLSSCKEKTINDIVNEGLDFSVKQYNLMSESFSDSTRLPRTTNEDGSLKTVSPADWTSGFYPGSLWYLYEYTKDTNWKNKAIKETIKLEVEQYDTTTHDLGFMLFDSYGQALRLTEDTNYTPILVQGAKSLIKRYKSKVGLIRSWDHGDWQYPVIIDNMMNLEYLIWATRYTEDSTFYNIAISHADKTIKNHFRPDNSTYHVVSYDSITGEPIEKVTCQGYSDSSSWARGQAWGLYGFTMMFRETNYSRYLKQAIAIAEFIINNPNLPADGVPYWDFNAPNIPNAERDASAGAIICSALLELSGFCGPELKEKYIKHAEKLIRTLSSKNFRARLGENNNFILMHSVGSLPHKNEINVPLNYADYYYIESLLRYKKLKRE